jgi:aryl-alcohol dehydrogenase-like predicted oxidoreductase
MSDILKARLSRRSFVAAGIGAGVSLALGKHAHAAAGTAAASTDAPITRVVPSTGERLPVIGLGTNAYGVTDAAEYAARREVLEKMPGMGGKVVDTARAYGDSELVIGRAMKELGNRDRLFLASKTPISGDVSGGRSVVKESFRRLQVDTIDLMQIHNLHGLDSLMPILVAMKAEKRIRYVGMSTSTDEQYEPFLAGLARHPVDFLQVDYSIENRNAAERILPLAQDKGIAVLVNMPFGGRRGGNLFPQVRERALPEWAKEADIGSWAQFFLKYVVAHPAVTCVIPGTTKLANLVDNQGGGRGRLPNAALRRKMEEFWDAG